MGSAEYQRQYRLKNREKWREYQRKYYKKHKKYLNKIGRDNYQKRREALLANQTRRANERLQWVRQFKERPCADCGVQYPPYVMDFDHRKGTKKDRDMAYMAKHRSKERILAEIAKCDVVCANCHRERTHKIGH